HFGTRSPPHIVLQNQISGVEVGLWPNPDVIPDLAGSIETPLHHDLGSDKHAVPDLYRLRVLQHDVRSHLKVVTHLPVHRTHEHSSHQHFKRAFSGSESSEKGQQILFGMAIA